MRAFCVGVLTGFVTIGTAARVSAQEVGSAAIDAPIQASRFLVDFDAVAPPPAFIRFCIEMPEECIARPPSKRLDQSARRLEELDEVNGRVNHTILPETDIQHYGIQDYWTIPQDGKGDCEDYALLKRHILISMGWPTSALLMTVVRDEKDEGHAVLTARTFSGDLILDNKSDQLKFWYQTPYKFKMRQSPQDPQVWLDLDPSDDALPTPIAGLKLLFGFNQQALHSQHR
jgi:predicted transglutaminase-like cysteine proteinase